jgi:hypothetical protein
MKASDKVGNYTNISAVKELPADFQPYKVLTLSGKRASLRLNLAAIPFLFFFGWLFKFLINLGRGSDPFTANVWGVLGFFSGIRIVLLPLAIILMLILHELIHGLFFWLYTHDRPRFALKAGYAFAAAIVSGRIDIEDGRLLHPDCAGSAGIGAITRFGRVGGIFIFLQKHIPNIYIFP